MSLATLPQEVLELLFLYVDKEDLLAACNAVGFEGSNSFWRQICKREDFNKISKEDDCWKTVFHRNINWTTGKFVKREYNFEKYERDLFDSDNFRCVYVKDMLHGKHLILKSGEDEISIWNIDSRPVMITKLSAQFLRISRSKLLVHYHIPKAKIYLGCNNTQCEIFNLNDNLSRNVSSDYALTDEYFAAFDDSLISIKVVNLEKREDYMLSLSNKKVKPLSIAISGSILNIMVLEGSQYVLRRYNLEKTVWLDDLVLFQGAALIAIPKLEISSDIIVSWSNLHIRHGITPVKIWKMNGELLRSLSFEFIQSFGIQLLMPPEQILWLIAEGEYIIFSTYVTSITIWTSKDPDICKEMPKSEHFYNGQSVISSHLLVLSYNYCFKVVDFHKAVYLYDVWFEDRQLNSSALYLPQPYYVNEYFYVYFKECEIDESPVRRTIRSTRTTRSKAEDCSKTEVSFNLDESSHVDSKTKTTRPFKTYKLTIYDFRAESMKS